MIHLIFYIPIDPLKFFIRYTLTGRAWDLVIEQRIAFTRKRNFGREERELRWAHAQRTPLHGLDPPETGFTKHNNYAVFSRLAKDANRRAEIARLRELSTVKGHVESVVKLKGPGINTIQQSYTV